MDGGFLLVKSGGLCMVFVCFDFILLDKFLDDFENEAVVELEFDCEVAWIELQSAFAPCNDKIPNLLLRLFAGDVSNFDSVRYSKSSSLFLGK